jgi:hypothetical protein
MNGKQTKNKPIPKKKNQTYKRREPVKKTALVSHCSPAVKNKTPIENSCFTTEVLQKIKIEYNPSKPESNQIKETDPNKIWNELRNRLVHCKKEKCWLNQIKNVELRNQIDQYIFAPAQPPEWKDNPNTWLSNYDILKVLNQYEEAYPAFEFIGPTPIDFDKRLPKENGVCVTQDLCHFSLQNQLKQGKTKIGIIFNLSPHTSSGSHWVSLFMDIKEKHIFYFDSNGIKAPKEIREFIKRCRKEGLLLKEPIVFKQKENRREHQMGNTECGMYSLFFIITMLTGEVEIKPDEKKTKMSLQEKIDFFSERRIPDEYVQQFRDTFFHP